jgi:hypothetical protein
MTFEITWDEVKDTAKDIADELELFTTAQRDLVLEEAYCKVPEDVYSETTTRILRRFWAAHVAANSLLDPAGEGALTSESIGSVSSNRNQPVNNPQADQYWGETLYGRAYHNKIADIKKRNQIDFGVYNCGEVSGFPKVLGDC